MTERRSVDDALPPDAVQAVPTKAERLAALLFKHAGSLAALVILTVAMAAAVALLFTSTLYKEGFQLLNSLASGAAGYFFATRSKSDD